MRSFAAVPYTDPNALETGEATIPRFLASASLTTASGSMRLTYFTATKTETVTSIRLGTTGTAAGATPTLVRFGLYSVAANGDLTLVASTVNDTTIFAAANTWYTKAVSTPYAKTKGQRYAVACLVVTAAAAPLLVSAPNMGGSSAESALAPRIGAALNSQTDLPASVTSASLATSAQMFYAAVTP